jgi:anti-anti-sigma regulatory factor
MSASNVSVACFDRLVWLRVQGRGNFQGCPSMMKFVQAMILRGYREFVIDLASCEHMDSTFMGTITGISQSLRELGQGSLRALNVNARNVELFSNLGLDMLFTVEPAGPVPVLPAEEGASFLELPAETGGPERDVILAAHQALVAANPANAERFRDVLDYLQGSSQ